MASAAPAKAAMAATEAPAIKAVAAEREAASVVWPVIAVIGAVVTPVKTGAVVIRRIAPPIIAANEVAMVKPASLGGSRQCEGGQRHQRENEFVQ
jgi:hypothetical protein